MKDDRQHIHVFQQNGSGDGKIRGIRDHAGGAIRLMVTSIDGPLPEVIDDTTPFLPRKIAADLVLDFLTHPDLSYDLAVMCARRGIPVVASGKRFRVEGAATPPT